MPAGALHVGFSLWLATLCDCTSLLPRSLRLTGAAVEAEPRPRAARPPPNRSALLAVEAGRLGPRRPGQLDSLYPRARHAACGAPRAADSGSRAGERCPAACPLYQEDLQGGGARGCVFRCVESSAQACAAANPGATVADPEWGICRSCWVEGCQRCAGDGTDRCAECAISFQLVGGRCVGRYGWVWKAAAAVAACLVLVLALWVANLRGRPVTNPYAVDIGVRVVSSSPSLVYWKCLLVIKGSVTVTRLWLFRWCSSWGAVVVIGPTFIRQAVPLAMHVYMRKMASRIFAWTLSERVIVTGIPMSVYCCCDFVGNFVRPCSSSKFGKRQLFFELVDAGEAAGADVGERLPGERAAEVPAAVDDSAGTPVEVQRSASAESYGFAAGSGELHADQPPGPPARGAAVTAEPSYGRLSYADSYGSPRWAPARSDSSGSGASGDAARRDPRSIMGKAEQCKDEFASTRRMWPLSTNLCKQDVAGPGVILSFNFQAGVMLWGLAVAVLWAAMAFLIDTDLLRMGTRSASTPRDQCIVMAWGFETQRRLMWAKVLFLAFVYALSSGGALLHSVRQLRAFQRIDEVETTHRDYAVKLSGIPAMDPSRFVEEELKDLLESATRKPAVGVSVCWCIKSQSQSDLLNGTIAFDLQEREEAVTGIKPDEGGDSPAAHQERTLVDRLFASIESAFVQEGFQRILRKGKSRQKGLHGQPRRRRELPPQGPRLPVHEDADYPVRDESAQSLGGVVVEELLGMSHSGEAWAVFNTQADRDEAVEAVASARGIEFEGSVITLEKAALDPDSILWENSGFLNSTSDLVMKLAVGGGVVMLSLAVWVVAFFGPYAYFVTNATYTYGQEPSNTEVFVFSGVVIAGNALMCLVCSEVSDWVGFHTTDAREVCNMLLYPRAVADNLACVVQVVLDLAITYSISYLRLVGREIRTYDGTPLSELPTFVERIEAYPMQQELGREVYMFAWPATFLLPFLIEPLITVYVPFKLMEYIVRSHREITYTTAEAYAPACYFSTMQVAPDKFNT
ncbi:unnamed protein product [Prorocentrum cordatum]|uniref:Uncharacterized protein n=1 Tax=Prorocentrum cordatum TaxID=2364126 RepID=A0ABN9PH80_9DINO|nr:unnamed protein product [Polarella glacialis]